VQGRFTSPDSYFGLRSNPQTLNLYAYVQNNPLAFVDPTGHWSMPSISGFIGEDRWSWADDLYNAWLADHEDVEDPPDEQEQQQEQQEGSPQDPVTAVGNPPAGEEIVGQMNLVTEEQVREFNASTCVGNTCDCVPLVKELTGTQDVHTSRWRPGDSALNPTLPYGTPIATFIGGRYRSLPTGNHAAILLGQVPRSREYPNGGILVLDQFPNRGSIGIRVIENRNGRGSRSDDASRFSVIWIAPPPEPRRR